MERSPWVEYPLGQRGSSGSWTISARRPPFVELMGTHPNDTKAAPVRTYTPKAGEITRQWHVIDATDVVLGRLASQAAILLRGKHKTTFAPHVDGGDFVIIINADKVQMTGNKRDDKRYYWHTGHPGGIKFRTARQVLDGAHPERVVIKAVERMISRNKLGKQQMTNLRVYAGDQHPHEAQQPEVLDVKSMNTKNTRSA